MGKALYEGRPLIDMVELYEHIFVFKGNCNLKKKKTKTENRTPVKLIIQVFLHQTSTPTEHSSLPYDGSGFMLVTDWRPEVTQRYGLLQHISDRSEICSMAPGLILRAPASVPTCSRLG